MADISDTLAPKSDQLDNIDLRGTEPRIFTVTQVDVKPGAEQPVTVHLAEFPRPWKPGKNMRRVLAHCWGRESDNWVGKRVELFSDERVKFGNETPGGTRISRLSDIDGPKSAPVMLRPTHSAPNGRPLTPNDARPSRPKLPHCKHPLQEIPHETPYAQPYHCRRCCRRHSRFDGCGYGCHHCRPACYLHAAYVCRSGNVG
jgi:hypothetical protein